MPQQCKFKGFVFIFLLFFLTFNVTARDNNDIDDCISGETGNLKIRIIEPDESENFELGETIDVEVEVANLGDKTRDVVVDVSLYNVDEENTISQEDSDDERLSPGEDENFDIEFKIPTKARGIDNDDEFILFVKAFDEDSEKGACEEEAVDIDLEFDGETENDNVILEVECKETIDSRTSNKTSEVLLVVGSDKPSKSIEPVQVIKVGEISTLFLVDFVLLLFLIFLIVVLVKL